MPFVDINASLTLFVFGIGVRANIHLVGVKPSFARMANANCLSRGSAREKKKIMNYCRAYFLTVVE